MDILANIASSAQSGAASGRTHSDTGEAVKLNFHVSTCMTGVLGDGGIALVCSCAPCRVRGSVHPRTRANDHDWIGCSHLLPRSPVPTVNWGAVWKTDNLNARVQTHLAQVYGTLALTLIASVVGVVADINFHLGGALSSIGCIMIMFLLGFDQDKTNWQKRVSLLGVYGFLQGCSIGPLINMALQVDPAIVMTAFLGTATIFVCFSLSAIYSERRSYIFLGGMLSSAMMFMCILSLVSIFYRPVWIYSIQMYFGLAVFCAYVLYDTQLIIEKAENGSDDFVWHVSRDSERSHESAMHEVVHESCADSQL